MTHRRSHGKPRDDWQSVFVAGLRDSAVTYPDTIRKVEPGRTVDDWIISLLTLSTEAMRPGVGGLKVQPSEQVVIAVPPNPMMAPTVLVAHDRFDGYPHVLTNHELCIFLDPSREWNPEAGAIGFLDRLFRWFEEAVAGAFDPETALFHPVGGRAHFGPGSPMVVCHQEIPFDKDLAFAYLAPVGATRRDLLAESDGAATTERILTIRAKEPLHHGPGSTVTALLGRLGTLGPAAMDALVARVHRRDDGDHTHILVGVPRPDGRSRYLLVGRLQPSAGEDASRQAIGEMGIEWCTLSDERPSVSTRRDQSRPVSAFQGKHVAVLGCGGLGSWIAEFIARASPASISLFDPAKVTGGLLVRQNYTDADVSKRKSVALAERIREIAPSLKVIVDPADGLAAHAAELLTRDDGIVIDSTVSIAVAQVLERLVPAEKRRGLQAQVATDVATGSLGLVVVAAPGQSSGPRALDESAGKQVKQTAELEPYLTFWEPRASDEFIPNKGCSYPTFHGSAADMAAIAAEQVNLIAQHIGSGESAVHLFALPHTGVEPPHRVLAP